MPAGITSAFCLSTPRLPQIGAVLGTSARGDTKEEGDEPAPEPNEHG